LDTQNPPVAKEEESWLAVTGGIAFFVSWGYCVAEYGFLLGLGLGWLPSIFVAFLAAIFWPFLLMAVVLFVAVLMGFIR